MTRPATPALPDLGPVVRIDAEAADAAIAIVDRMDALVMRGTPHEEQMFADVMDEDEVLVVIDGKEHVSTFRSDASLIVGLSHAVGTDHLEIDARLIRALGITTDAQDARHAVLAVLHLARSIVRRAGGSTVDTPTVHDALQKEADLSGALGRPGTLGGIHAVGGGAMPIVPAQQDGDIASTLLKATIASPLLTVHFDDGPFGAVVEIGAMSYSFSSRPLDALERLRLIAGHRRDQGEAA